MKVKINGAEINVEFKIIAVDEVKGQLSVRYYNEDFPEGFVNTVDLPVQGGKIVALQGEALAKYIIGCGPMAEFARAKAEKPDLSYLAAMVEEDHVQPPAPPPPPAKPAAVIVPDLTVL